MTNYELLKSSSLCQVSSVVVVDVCRYTAVFVIMAFGVMLLIFLVLSNRLFRWPGHNLDMPVFRYDE